MFDKLNQIRESILMYFDDYNDKEEIGKILLKYKKQIEKENVNKIKDLEEEIKILKTKLSKGEVS